MFNCIWFTNIKFKKFNYRIKYIKERDFNFKYSDLDTMIKHSEKYQYKTC